MELDFKTLYNHAPCGYLFAMEDGTIIDVNDTFLAFTGYSREEIIENKSFEDFLSIGGKIYYETHFAPLLKMHGEVSQINFDFNRKDQTRFPVLINAIKQSFNEKKDNYIQFIVLDITQRKQYELELLNAKRKSEELLIQLSNANNELTSNIQVIAEQSYELEKLNATKDKFFSIVAHDLKSPLSTLKMFLSLLIDDFDSFNKDDILTMSKELNDSVDSTIKMADNLITWAMVQMGESQYNEETLKVKDITSNIFDVYQNVALKKGINVSYSVDDALTVIGDKNQIEFVIRNLVNNAIKFTHQGKISINVNAENATATNDTILFEIKDTGIGIPKSKQNLVFESFTQADLNTTRLYGGTGLGLSICKKLVERMGSTIQLTSAEGEGSSFSFSLTFPKTLILSNNESNSIDAITNTVEGKNILLVEDNTINAKVMTGFFKKWKINFELAENGKIATEKVEEGKYDLILMDLQMPVMDGYEATKLIKSRQISTPIIALSAEALHDIKTLLEEFGFNDYVSKPFVPQDLIDKIAYFTSQQFLGKNIQNKDSHLVSFYRYNELANNDEAFLKMVLKQVVEEFQQVYTHLQNDSAYFIANKILIESLVIKLTPSIKMLSLSDLYLKLEKLLKIIDLENENGLELKSQIEKTLQLVILELETKINKI